MIWHGYETFSLSVEQNFSLVMAQANNLRFQVRGPNGTQKTLDPLPSSSTMQDLQSAIIKGLNFGNVQPACVEIKFVSPPPTVISQVAPDTSLSSLKLSSGNLIVSVLNSSDQSKPEAEESAASNASEQKEDSKEQGSTFFAEALMKQFRMMSHLDYDGFHAPIKKSYPTRPSTRCFAIDKFMRDYVKGGWPLNASSTVEEVRAFVPKARQANLANRKKRGGPTGQLAPFVPDPKRLTISETSAKDNGPLYAHMFLYPGASVEKGIILYLHGGGFIQGFALLRIFALEFNFHLYTAFPKWAMQCCKLWRSIREWRCWASSHTCALRFLCLKWWTSASLAIATLSTRSKCPTRRSLSLEILQAEVWCC